METSVLEQVASLLAEFCNMLSTPGQPVLPEPLQFEGGKLHQIKVLSVCRNKVRSWCYRILQDTALTFHCNEK